MSFALPAVKILPLFQFTMAIKSLSFLLAFTSSWVNASQIITAKEPSHQENFAAVCKIIIPAGIRI
jgi:hypothetical protein